MDIFSYLLGKKAGGNKKYKPRRTNFGLYQGTELEYELENIDTSNFQTFVNMFFNCSNLISVDLKNIKGNNSALNNGNYNNFFSGCTNLTTITNIENLVNSKATSLGDFFQGCSSLTKLDLRGWDTTNVKTFSTMFKNCTNLTEIDMSSFTTGNDLTTLTSQVDMFYGCTNLTKIDMRNCTFSKLGNSFSNSMFGSDNSTYVPANCLIIVKNNTEKNWFTNRFSRMINVKTVDEYNQE